MQFRTPEDAGQAGQRSNQVLGSRYVEVFRCTRLEMEQARMHAMSVLPKQWPGQSQMHHMSQMDQQGQQGFGNSKSPQGGGGGRRNQNLNAQESAYSAYQAPPPEASPFTFPICAPRHARASDTSCPVNIVWTPECSQAALHTLASRPAASQYPQAQVPAYGAPTGTYASADPNYAATHTNAAYSNTAGYTAGYGTTEVAYSNGAVPGAVSGAGYAQDSAGYGQGGSGCVMVYLVRQYGGRAGPHTASPHVRNPSPLQVYCR